MTFRMSPPWSPVEKGDWLLNQRVKDLQKTTGGEVPVPLFQPWLKTFWGQKSGRSRNHDLSADCDRRQEPARHLSSQATRTMEMANSQQFSLPLAGRDLGL